MECHRGVLCGDCPDRAICDESWDCDICPVSGSCMRDSCEDIGCPHEYFQFVVVPDTRWYRFQCLIAWWVRKLFGVEV